MRLFNSINQGHVFESKNPKIRDQIASIDSQYCGAYGVSIEYLIIAIALFCPFDLWQLLLQIFSICLALQRTSTFSFLWSSSKFYLYSLFWKLLSFEVLLFSRYSVLCVFFVGFIFLSSFIKCLWTVILQYIFPQDFHSLGFGNCLYHFNFIYVFFITNQCVSMSLCCNPFFNFYSSFFQFFYSFV